LKEGLAETGQLLDKVDVGSMELDYVLTAAQKI